MIDLLMVDYERRRRMARKDSDAFREFIIKDDRTGKPIVQEPLHKSWTQHINRCRDSGKHCAILAPWGHGKTVSVAIAETLWIIAHNPSVRVKLVCCSDVIAMDRLRAIKHHIEHNEDFQRAFPEIKPDKTRQWSDHRIYVERDSNAIDPTVDARGLLSTGIGGRADVIIFDDPVDERSIDSEKIRESARRAYNNLWMSRLVDNGFVLYICTRWAEEDLTKTIMQSGAYLTLIQRVSDDFSCIEQEVV